MGGQCEFFDTEKISPFERHPHIEADPYPTSESRKRRIHPT